MLRSSTNSSTQTHQSSIHPLPAQRLKRLVATGHELSWRLQFQTRTRERLGNMKRDSLSTRSERPQGPLSDLERSEFYLREGERLAHMGSWSLRPDGIFDYWSPETFVIFGFDPGNGIPTLREWLDVLHPADRDAVVEQRGLNKVKSPIGTRDHLVAATCGQFAAQRGEGKAKM
jgi:hypothetical protein